MTAGFNQSDSLLAKYLEMLRTDFNEIFRKCRRLAKKHTIDDALDRGALILDFIKTFDLFDFYH